MLCSLCLASSNYVLRGMLGNINDWRPLEKSDDDTAIRESLAGPAPTDGRYPRPCWFIYVANFSELESSAIIGCQICMLISQSTYDGPIRHRRKTDSKTRPVRIFVAKERAGPGAFQVYVGRNGRGVSFRSSSTGNMVCRWNSF